MTTVEAQTFTQKILFTGTQANYNALASKSASALYFITDTQKLYKGTVDYSASARVVAALPAAGSAANNVLYVVADGAFTQAAVTTDAGTTWTKISVKTIDVIDDDSTSAGYNGNDTNSVPSTKAVVDYVVSKVGTSGAITSIAKNADTAAHIDYSTNGSTAVAGSVEVGGVSLIPTFDSSTQVLTIPYTGFGSTSAGEVEVDFGKYSLVEEAEYNATTETIDFWISGHSKEDYPTTPSFSIDVAALITEIAVDDTDSVDLTMTIGSDGTSNHRLSAEVKIATKTGVTNYAAIATTADTAVTATGILVDLTTLEDSINNNAQSITNLETAITTWGEIPAAVEP
jgi:hypothetical protein